MKPLNFCNALRSAGDTEMAARLKELKSAKPINMKYVELYHQ